MHVVTLKSAPAGISLRIEADDETKSGAEGVVYFSRDGQYAVKVYHQLRPEKEILLRSVMTIFQSLPPEHEHFILPPLALVGTVDGQPRVGFIMKRVSSRYDELVDFMLNPVVAAKQFKQGKTWANYLKLARSVAKAIVVLNGKGCAHSDIHFRNFLVNLDDGDAIMLDIDGVVVAGFLPPQVAGMMGFIAPEILTQKSLPSERTDRYSLALLVLHTLLFRNVMQPLVEYADDPNQSEELGWGLNALFSEHPQDRRHRPRQLARPLYQGGSLSYRMLTARLQRLTERAFLDGLRDPDKRPSAREWEEGLACVMDELWMCLRCQQWFPYPHWQNPVARRACPFCGERIQAPYPVVLQLYEERGKHNFFAVERLVVLGPTFKVFRDVLTPGDKPSLNRRNEQGVGHVEWDRQTGVCRLVNDEGSQWQARSKDCAQQVTAGKGQSLPLSKGAMIHLGVTDVPEGYSNSMEGLE